MSPSAGAGPSRSGYRAGMDTTPVAIIIGVVIAAFIVLGMVWAFLADRRRNQEVAHDTDRFDQPPAQDSPNPLRHGDDTA